MITENEIKNQIAIGKTLHEQGKWSSALPEEDMDRADFYKALEERWFVAGYITALKYVLGEEPPKFDKEDM